MLKLDDGGVSHSAACVVDGKPDTHWLGRHNSHLAKITVDLGAPYRLTKIRVVWHMYASRYALEVCLTDPRTVPATANPWHLVHKTANGSGNPQLSPRSINDRKDAYAQGKQYEGDGQVFILHPPVVARWVRLDMSGAGQKTSTGEPLLGVTSIHAYHSIPAPPEQITLLQLLTRNPNNHTARLRLGRQLLAREAYDTAVEVGLELLRRAPAGWGNNSAVRLLEAVFQRLGHEDLLVVEARKQMLMIAAGSRAAELKQ